MIHYNRSRQQHVFSTSKLICTFFIIFMVAGEIILNIVNKSSKEQIGIL